MADLRARFPSLWSPSPGRGWWKGSQSRGAGWEPGVEPRGVGRLTGRPCGDKKARPGQRRRGAPHCVLEDRGSSAAKRITRCEILTSGGCEVKAPPMPCGRNLRTVCFYVRAAERRPGSAPVVTAATDTAARNAHGRRGGRRCELPAFSTRRVRAERSRTRRDRSDGGRGKPSRHVP